MLMQVEDSYYMYLTQDITTTHTKYLTGQKTMLNQTGADII